jgi:hypothetical protein
MMLLSVRAKRRELARRKPHPRVTLAWWWLKRDGALWLVPLALASCFAWMPWQIATTYVGGTLLGAVGYAAREWLDES